MERRWRTQKPSRWPTGRKYSPGPLAAITLQSTLKRRRRWQSTCEYFWSSLYSDGSRSHRNRLLRLRAIALALRVLRLRAIALALRVLRLRAIALALRAPHNNGAGSLRRGQCLGWPTANRIYPECG